MPLCGVLEPALVHSPRIRGRLGACSARFHSATRWYAQSANHYDVLGVKSDASQVEIKRQFYALSKLNHPDLHPDDSSASSRFQTISAAYHILADPSKRARYDRDSGLGAAFVGAAHTPSGSYSSAQARAGPFGARPASGLSKRRTTFRGPPPSFYRSGGYGDQAEKRRAASQDAGSSSESTAGTEAAGGFSPGQGTYDKYWSGNVPHFDRQAHFERQEGINSQINKRRRARRRGGEGSERDYIDRDFATRFILVGSLVFGGWLAHLPFTHG